MQPNRSLIFADCLLEKKQPADGLLQRRVASHPGEEKNRFGTGLAPQRSGLKLSCRQMTNSVYSIARKWQGRSTATAGN
jgi:hypothetical protein